MRKFSQILKKCPLFLGIDEDFLYKMLECLGARVVEYEKSFTVFAEGSAARHIGVVLSGAVQIEQIDYFGKRSILSKVGAGGLVLAEFACAESDYLPVSAVATEPTVVMHLSCSHILHTCSNACGFHHTLIYNLMKALATDCISYHRRIEITSKRTTREKLLAYLSSMAKETGKRSFDIPFNRQELADYLEVDRSGLSVEISKLIKEGYIEAKKRRFTLLDDEDDFY